MTQEQEDKLIEAKLVSMMEEDQPKLMSFLLLIASHNLIDGGFTSSEHSQHNDYKGKRYKVKVHMSVEEIPEITLDPIEEEIDE